MSSLSSGCQAAVRAVEAPAAPKAEAHAERPAKAEAARRQLQGRSRPAATPPAATNLPKAASAAKKPSSAQVAAIRSACRTDYQKNCAGVPTGGAAALSCLEKNKSNSRQTASRPLARPAAAQPPARAPPAAPGWPAAAPAAAPAPALVLRPMRPREVLFVLRSACGGDVRALCGGVPAGGGRIIECLASAGRFAFARMRGCSGPVRRAIAAAL